MTQPSSKKNLITIAKQPQEALLFCTLLILQILFYINILMEHRIPAGHDGFQYFMLQYYFLNSAVFSGEIAQWMPFMMHGTTSTWSYPLQAGLLQNVLLHIGPILKNFNFLTIFHLGFFIDELLLLVGVWLLAKRFFSNSLTVFFVSASIMGSSIWMIQPWWNFHFYYALPLILYFGHLFLESGKWRYAFFAVNLLALQTFGQPLYCLPMVSLIVFLYFLSYGVIDFKKIYKTIKNFRYGWPCIFCLAGIIISLMGVYFVLHNDARELVSYAYKRNLDGTTPLNVFLTYAGNLTLIKWLELFLGVSPCIDYTLYIGFLSVTLAVYGLIVNCRKESTHLVLVILILLTINTGTIVATFFYHMWPMLKFYRHLTLISPFIKIFLCFLAGYGFEAMFNTAIEEEKKKLFHYLSWFMAGLMILLSLFLFYFSSHYDVAAQYILHMVERLKADSSLSILPALFDKNVLTGRLTTSASLALLTAIIFGIWPFIHRRKYFMYCVALVLALHIVDIYGYKFSELYLKTVALKKPQYDLTYFQPIVYNQKRQKLNLAENPRTSIFYSLTLPSNDWFSDSFLFNDEIGSSFRVDYWLKPLDNFMRAYWKQPIHNLSIPPAGLLPWVRLDFPLTHPAAAKIAGLTENKIQFFSDAFLVNDENQLVSTLTSLDYAGDLLLLSSQKKEAIDLEPKALPANYPLSRNVRLSIPYQLKKFDSNALQLTVDIAHPKGVWMLYSDVWHLFWKATVNGKPVKIFKANLAYKAIQLPVGFDRVHFFFNSRLTSFLFIWLGLNALFWITMVFYLAGKILKNK